MKIFQEAPSCPELIIRSDEPPSFWISFLQGLTVFLLIFLPLSYLCGRLILRPLRKLPARNPPPSSLREGLGWSRRWIRPPFRFFLSDFLALMLATFFLFFVYFSIWPLQGAQNSRTLAHLPMLMLMIWMAWSWRLTCRWLDAAGVLDGFYRWLFLAVLGPCAFGAPLIFFVVKALTDEFLGLFTGLSEGRVGGKWFFPIGFFLLAMTGIIYSTWALARWTARQIQRQAAPQAWHRRALLAFIIFLFLGWAARPALWLWAGEKFGADRFLLTIAMVRYGDGEGMARLLARNEDVKSSDFYALVEWDPRKPPPFPLIPVLLNLAAAHPNWEVRRSAHSTLKCFCEPERRGFREWKARINRKMDDPKRRAIKERLGPEWPWTALEEAPAGGTPG